MHKFIRKAISVVLMLALVTANLASVATFTAFAADAPILDFRFTDGSLADESGEYTLVSADAAASDGVKDVNGAVSYTGVRNSSWQNPNLNLYMDISNVACLDELGDDITISFWVKPTSYANCLLGAYVPDADTSVDNHNGYWFIKASSDAYLAAECRAYDASSNGAVLSTAEGLSLNEWNMVTITQQTKEGKLVSSLYLNGKIAVTSDTPASYASVFKNGQYLTLGSSVGWNDSSCSGTYDSFSIYNYAVSSEAVAAEYMENMVSDEIVVTSVVDTFKFDMEFGDSCANYIDQLPDTVTVNLSDGNTAAADVSWNTGSLSNTAGTHEIFGSITVPDHPEYMIMASAKAEFNIAAQPDNIVYLSDLTYIDSKFAWNTAYIDKGQGSDNLALYVDGEYTYFAKGVGANAGKYTGQTYLTYNIPENAYTFEAYVGNTYINGPGTACYFAVALDGVDVTPDALKNTGHYSGDPASHLVLNVVGKKTITIYYDTHTNGNADANSTYADAKFTLTDGSIELPEIVAINENIEDIDIAFGDSYMNHLDMLPKTISVQLDNGEVGFADVSWNTSSLGNTPGSYTATGTLTSLDYLVAEGVQATAVFNVGEQPENIVYLSDINYETFSKAESTASWDALFLDVEQDSGNLALYVDGKYTYFTKSIATNGSSSTGDNPSYVTYSIPDNATSFEAYFGNTKSGNWGGAVLPAIEIDGELLSLENLSDAGYQPSDSKTDAYHAVIDVTGKKTITLWFNTLGFDGGANAAYLDAKFIIGNTPADYTAVDAALDKAAALTEGDYTEASWSKLQTAVNAVVRDLTASEQATVDGYAAAIEAAILALVPTSVEMSLTIGAGMVTAAAEGKYDITWNAHILLGEGLTVEDINQSGLKVKNYGVYYATGKDVLDDYKNASADQIRKIVFAQGEDVDVYTAYGFRLKNVVENRVRAAMFYIEYELNGQNYILLSTVDEVVAVIAA